MANSNPTRWQNGGPVENFPGPANANPNLVLVGENGVVNGAPSVGTGTTNGGGAGGGTTSPSGTTATGTSTSPLVINISWDSSVASAPSGFTTGVMAAVSFLESQFTDPVTINISVGYGEVGGTTLGSSALGSSQTYLSGYSYSTLYNALKADATTAADASGVAALPATAPVGNANYWVSTAEAKALGLMGASTATDGFVGFSSSLPFDYNNTDGIATGTYDFYGTVVHELTEVMGRILLAGTTLGASYPNSYDAFDLFRFSSAGVHNYSTSMGGYFSADNGQTNLGTFNNTSGGDYGDWKSLTNDSFNAFSSSGVINPVTTNDLTTLDTIGWNLASATTPPPSPTAPTGVDFSQAAYAAGTIATGGNGLAANVAIGTAAQMGGTSGDSFTYLLGGVDVGLFNLASASNLGSLAVGASAVAGATNGRLYNLAVTAQDTTASLSSPAVPLGVIVGSSGADAISVSTVLGGSTTTPAFIYGLAGNDSLNGTGISADLFLAGGGGADLMTAGSGTDVFMYGARTDSNASAMDVISSFTAAQDLIDLRGLGVTLNVAGQIGGSGKLAAHSIAWQVSGGNTYVYVNTSGFGERLSSTDMKIELTGNVSLTASNFQHL